MLIQIPEVLNQEEVGLFRKELDNTSWVDGKVTAGYQSAQVKENMQLPETSVVAIELGRRIVQALHRNPLFISAALPAKIFPPLFNRYDGGHSFGNHVDNSIRRIPATGEQIRTDLSVTLFLSSPEEYDGGELIVDDTYGAHSVKLPAGHMVLYPSTSLHRVLPVTVHFSGFRVWCAGTSSAAFYSIWTWPFRRSGRICQNILRWSNLPVSITTCSENGLRSSLLRQNVVYLTKGSESA